MVTLQPYRSVLLLAALSLLPSAFAQTFTDCNPLNKTTCPDDLALGSRNYTIDFTTTTPSTQIWNTTAGTVNYTDNGAEFTINKKGDSPTIQSQFYIFFGTVEIHVKAATGQGVVSSSVMESDDLDEVDWEWLGANTTSVETNYFGKGDTSTFNRAIYYDVNEPMTEYHNYTVDWSSERIEWIIDGTVVRTLEYDDAESGTRFPQTPMNVRIGIWAGGDPDESEGTIEWAGGKINYDDAPFTMYVQSVRVTDSGNATAYKYGDTSGNWTSIEYLEYNVNTTTKPIDLDATNSANSTSSSSSSNADSISNSTSVSSTNSTTSSSSNSTSSTTDSAIKKWDGLSKNAKIAVGSSAIGVVAVAVAVLSFCCVKQRGIGRKEREAADREYEKQTTELLAWRNQMGQQRTEYLRNLQEDGQASPNPAAAVGGGGIGGRMKRMSQSMGFGGNSNNNGGGYRGEYQRF